MNGWIPFEGGYFLFQGQQMDGIFTVDDVHLPIPKPFSQMPSLTKNDLFNRQKFAEAAESDKIVVLSDIWLDLEEVFVGLSNLFVHFAENPPVMFIFCGTFHSLSVGINYLPTEVENFRKLARLINDYSSTFPETKFVFVPSSDDFPSTPILPKLVTTNCLLFYPNLDHRSCLRYSKSLPTVETYTLPQIHVEFCIRIVLLQSFETM